jgi:hypothetical protein
MRESSRQEENEILRSFRGTPGLCGFAVESTCHWTARLLKKLGSFERAVGDFYRGQNVSPYAEKAGEQFLYQMSASQEPLVFAMARLELALMRVKQGSADEYLVEWDRNPELVFAALQSGGSLPPAEPGVRYRTYISRDIPELVCCEQAISTQRSAISRQWADEAAKQGITVVDQFEKIMFHSLSS